jgi:hypothetical protein
MSCRYCPSMSTKRAHSPDPIRSNGYGAKIKIERAGIPKPQIQATCSNLHPKKILDPRSCHFRISEMNHILIFHLDHIVLTIHPHISTFDHVRMPHSPSRTTRMTHNLNSSARPQLLYRSHPVSTTNTFVRFLCMYAYARSH